MELKTISGSLLSVMLLVLPLASARALPPARSGAASGRVPQGANVLAPFAYIRFCARNQQDCLPSRPATLAWNDDIVAMVTAVNRRVNHRMRSVDERLDSWNAGGPSGDCEDFALTKRRDLLVLGLPASALRMAVARTPAGLAHAVLIVSGSAGDLVLDNRNDRLLAWNRTDLTWLKIASAANPRIWLSATGRDATVW